MGTSERIFLIVSILLALVFGATMAGIQTADADFSDHLQPQPTNASYMLIEPTTTWTPLDCPEGMNCI